MRAIILAAGYATRLYPLTQNFPKPLLNVGGQTIIDRLLRQLIPLNFDDITVVCNQKFAEQFRAWQPANVTLLINSSTCEDNRLGAVGDLQFALESRNVDDVLVVAADNLFELNFQKFVEGVESSTICIWHNARENDRRRRGNVLVDDAGWVTRFVEKPGQSFSTWSAAPLYYYTRADVALVKAYLSQGGNADAPGHFVEWLAQVVPVRAFKLDEPPTDIGNIEALEAARAKFD